MPPVPWNYTIEREEEPRLRVAIDRQLDRPGWSACERCIIAARNTRHVHDALLHARPDRPVRHRARRRSEWPGNPDARVGAVPVTEDHVRHGAQLVLDACTH